MCAVVLLGLSLSTLSHAWSIEDGPGLELTEPAGPALSNLKDPGWFTFGPDCPEKEASCMVSNDGQATFLSGAVRLLIGSAGSFHHINLTFPGSRSIPPKGLEPLDHHTNHYIGADPDQWRTGLANYRQVLYPDLYPGIDLVYYFSPQGLKYDWRVEPGADPSIIRERYEETQVELGDDGSLVVTTAGGGRLDQAPPLCLQEIDVVTCSYQLSIDEQNGIVGYTLGDYDPTQVLIIDPLIFSTYLGGDDWELGADLALDEHGYSYLTGQTGSRTFPTTFGALERSHQGGSHDIFVTKLSSDGERLVYSTFIGGDDRDAATALALGPDGDVFVTGSTQSSDFPTTPGAHDRVDNGSSDGFVPRLDLASGELVYSTLLGGASYENIYDLQVDEQGHAFVTGITGSADFPVAGNDSSSGDDPPDLFVSRLTPDGKALNYSTVIGGEGYDAGTALDLDGEGVAWVAGTTDSRFFPTSPGAHDDSYNGANDLFVLGVNLTGATTYATYIGGTDDEEAHGLVAGSSSELLVTGFTRSDDLPTTEGVHSRERAGKNDGFVLRLTPGAPALDFSTYIGGTGDDGVRCLILDPQGHIIGGGHSDSHDFPSTGKGEYPSPSGEHDGVIFRLEPDGSRITYATYLGGEAYDLITGLKLDDTGYLTATGSTSSQEFPTTPEANDTTANGNSDIFVTRLDLNLPPTASINKVDPELAHEGEAVSFSGSGDDPDGEIAGYHWRSDIEGNLSNNASFSRSDLSPGNHTIYLAVMDNFGTWSDEVNTTLRVNGRPQATITNITGLPASQGDPLTFNGTGIDWDGHIDRHRWRSDVDGIIGSKASITTSLLSGGEHRIYLAVRDNEGAWSPEVWARVEINSRPTVTIEPAYMDLINEGEQVNLTGVASDPDGHILDYRWELDDQVMPQYQSRLTLANLTPGLHFINLTVVDNEAAWSDTATLELEVNARPQAAIDWVSHATAGEGWAVTFAGKAQDPDGRVVAYLWSSDLNGEFGDEENFTTSSLSPGNHTITLRVMDDDGAWSDEVTVTLVVTPVDEDSTIWPWVLGVLILLLVLSILTFLMVRRQSVPHVKDLPSAEPEDEDEDDLLDGFDVEDEVDELGEVDEADERVEGGTADDADRAEGAEVEAEADKADKPDEADATEGSDELITFAKDERVDGEDEGVEMDVASVIEEDGTEEGASDGIQEEDHETKELEMELETEEPTPPGMPLPPDAKKDYPVDGITDVVTCPTCFQDVPLDGTPGPRPVTCKSCWVQFNID